MWWLAMQLCLMSWTAPVGREDGSALALSEISHYELLLDGVYIRDLPVDASKYVMATTGALTMVTVDTYGLKSKPSAPVLCS